MKPSANTPFVDDRRDIREPLAKYLEKHDVRIIIANSSAAARKVLRTAALDLVIPGIMMPCVDGLQLCRHLRETTQILIIPRELSAGSDGISRFNCWSLDCCQRELVDEIGVATTPSPGEYRLFLALLKRSGMLLSWNQHLDLTRRRRAVPFDRTVGNQVSRLRQEQEQDPKLIVSFRGGGLQVRGQGGVKMTPMPGSLAGRLTLRLLFALEIARGVTISILSRERIETVRHAHRNNVVFRAGTVAQLLQVAPQSLHEAIVAVESSDLVRLSVTSKTPVGPQCLRGRLVRTGDRVSFFRAGSLRGNPDITGKEYWCVRQSGRMA